MLKKISQYDQQKMINSLAVKDLPNVEEEEEDEQIEIEV